MQGVSSPATVHVARGGGRLARRSRSPAPQHPISLLAAGVSPAGAVGAYCSCAKKLLISAWSF